MRLRNRPDATFYGHRASHNMYVIPTRSMASVSPEQHCRWSLPLPVHVYTCMSLRPTREALHTLDPGEMVVENSLRQGPHIDKESDQGPLVPCAAA